MKDPNIIAKYIDEINEMVRLREETGIEDIEELCSLLKLSDVDKENIIYCCRVYENNLKTSKNKSTKIKTL